MRSWPSLSVSAAATGLRIRLSAWNIILIAALRTPARLRSYLKRRPSAVLTLRTQLCNTRRSARSLIAMSTLTEHNIEVNPADERENGATPHQQPGGPQATDIEKGTTQKPWPPANSIEEDYVPRPSIFMIHFDNKGEIKYQGRAWGKDADTFSKEVPDPPANGLQVVILDLGPDDTDFKPNQLLDPSSDEPLKHKIGWKLQLRMGRQGAIYGSGDDVAEAYLEWKRSLLNVWRLQNICRKDVDSTGLIFTAQANIFESLLPSRPFPDRFFMLEQGGALSSSQSPARTWHNNIGAFNIRFWKTFSKVSVMREEGDRAVGKAPYFYPAYRDS
jgi:hypothetical protein